MSEASIRYNGVEEEKGDICPTMDRPQLKSKKKNAVYTAQSKEEYTVNMGTNVV